MSGRTILREVLQNFPDIGLEAHVKHSVCLIKDKITWISEPEYHGIDTERDQARRNFSSLHQGVVQVWR